MSYFERIRENKNDELELKSIAEGAYDHFIVEIPVFRLEMNSERSG